MVQAHISTDSTRNDRKEAGAHYTPTQLADFVADQLVCAWQKTHTGPPRNVVDPAVGDGELLHALVARMGIEAAKHLEVIGFDTDGDAISVADQRLSREFPGIKRDLKNADFLSYSENFSSRAGPHDLFSRHQSAEYDLVIANPPYVRTQVMGAVFAQELAAEFGLSGRVDLYAAFLCGIARILRTGGIAAVIVSNRFMTTKAGQPVRQFLLRHFEILNVWDLGDSKLFGAAVLPAVLLLRRSDSPESHRDTIFTSLYRSQSKDPGHRRSNLADALSTSGITMLNDEVFEVKTGVLAPSDNGSEVWTLSNDETSKWLSVVRKNTKLLFGDIGKIRVGIKTTADKVFIRDDWGKQAEQPELVRPLTTHKIARRFRAMEPRSSVLYPHTTKNGRRCVVPLSDFPRSSAYLEAHRTTLESRSYVREAGREWYEIWVPQDPQEWNEPKIVFRDIVDRPTFWLDQDKTIVNGDCYWLSARRGVQDVDMLWLALAVANSTFIEQFYDVSFNNKLYSGRRRFMTQYVEKFPLPDPLSEISRQMVLLARSIYNDIESPDVKKYEAELDRLVWRAFGLPHEESSGQRNL